VVDAYSKSGYEAFIDYFTYCLFILDGKILRERYPQDNAGLVSLLPAPLNRLDETNIFDCYVSFLAKCQNICRCSEGKSRIEHTHRAHCFPGSAFVSKILRYQRAASTLYFHLVTVTEADCKIYSFDFSTHISLLL